MSIATRKSDIVLTSDQYLALVIFFQSLCIMFRVPFFRVHVFTSQVEYPILKKKKKSDSVSIRSSNMKGFLT